MSHQPPHQTSPLEGSTPDDFSPFEARLAGLIPVTSRVDRDEIMFQAGRTTSHRAHHRTMRRWQAACGLLLCVTIGQWAWLPSIGELPPHPQIAQQAETAPAEKPRPEPQPQQLPSETVITPVESSEQPSPTPDVPPPESTQPAPPLPSLWGFEFLVRQPVIRRDLAGRGLTGNGLTVGSLPSAVWNEPAAPLRASRGPAPTPRTARELMTEWLKQPNFP